MFNAPSTLAFAGNYWMLPETQDQFLVGQKRTVENCISGPAATRMYILLTLAQRQKQWLQRLHCHMAARYITAGDTVDPKVIDESYFGEPCGPVGEKLLKNTPPPLIVSLMHDNTACRNVVWFGNDSRNEPLACSKPGLSCMPVIRPLKQILQDKTSCNRTLCFKPSTEDIIQHPVPAEDARQPVDFLIAHYLHKCQQLYRALC